MQENEPMTQTQTPTRRLLQHIRLKAPAARVYQALTDANELKKWFPHRVSTDPKVGGAWRFEFDMDAGGGTHVTDGRYLALVPGKLVRYSWIEELGDGEAYANLTVQWRLEADGEETDLYLEETGFTDDEAHDVLFGRRTKGWSFFMGNLAAYLVGGPDDR
jgi:uncharacterized protein YndB with AHSA1/START domain